MMTSLGLSVTAATDSDAGELALLRTEVAEHLTRRFGHGHWSAPVTEKGEQRSIKTSRILIARVEGMGIIATLRLATKKPWAIDKSYFGDVPRPLYLTDMAVAPQLQRQGVGRRLLEEAKVIAAEWPADAIRLDAYNSPAGAGPFYAKCGFREVGRATFRGVPLTYFELLLPAPPS
jgi:ribosomal protein S18 acetylase RimI-like enzyme